MRSFLTKQIGDKGFTHTPNLEKIRCDRASRGGFTPTPVFTWFCNAEVYPRTKKGFISRTIGRVFLRCGENRNPSHISISQRNRAKPFLVRGFTLFELLVSISIMLLMTMVVIFNYNDFRDDVGLTTATQGLSLDVRQMQSDALGVKQYIDPNDITANNTFDVGYGLRFYRDYNSGSSTYAVRSTGYTLFRDFLNPLTGGITGKYDEISNNSNPPLEFIGNQNLPTGYFIRDICMKDMVSSGSPVCFEKDRGSGNLASYTSVEAIDVVFTRPSSEASIRMFKTLDNATVSECEVSADVPCTFDYVSIEIASEKTGKCSAVRIYSSGQLSTGEACISDE
jgi:type II secretory pathway pseudopilin PulG